MQLSRLAGRWGCLPGELTRKDGAELAIGAGGRARVAEGASGEQMQSLPFHGTRKPKADKPVSTNEHSVIFTFVSDLDVQ